MDENVLMNTSYYECHVTIEPVFEDKLSLVEQIATKYRFKVAKLLMQKREQDEPERSKYDTFMTAHCTNIGPITSSMVRLIDELKSTGFKVWRYKIEHVVLDSRSNDEYKLLEE